MPKPSRRHLSDAGPQSIAEVWTTSGTRRRRRVRIVGLGPRGLWRSPPCLRHNQGLGRSDETAGGAQRKSSRRYLLYLDFHTPGQAVLDRNRSVVMGIDRQLDAHAPVANCAADALHGRRDAAILRPRKALQPQAGGLSGANAAERR